MKVLVSTKEGQGIRKNDFCFTKEGELVKMCFSCDGEKIDGMCGCRRSLGGFNTQKATTTFKVIEKKITEAQFIKLFIQSEKKAGWIKEGDNTFEFQEHAKDILRIAKSFPTYVILEKRGDRIQIRKQKVKV
jgi:hypothetical protein